MTLRGVTQNAEKALVGLLCLFYLKAATIWYLRYLCYGCAANTQNKQENAKVPPCTSQTHMQLNKIERSTQTCRAETQRQRPNVCERLKTCTKRIIRHGLQQSQEPRSRPRRSPPRLPRHLA